MAESLKALLLSPSFQVRGTSSYTLRLAERLGDYGIEAAVICPNANRVSVERRDALRIRVLRNLGMPVWGRVALRFLLAELYDDPPDLIHVQTRVLLPQANWLARQLRCPLVLSVHDYLHARERLPLDPVLRCRTIAVSDSVRTELAERTSLSEAMIQVIHPGVESDQSLAAASVLAPEHDPVIGCAGPLEALKGLNFFLGAAAMVCETHATARFLIAGAGPEERRLRSQMRSLQITDRVTFIPNMYDFSAALTAMDVFCLPSLRQGLGTIMLEAMSLGRPVIATDVGGVSSVVTDSATGLLVPPRHPQRMADAIRQLLNDPVRSRAIGEAGRQLIHEKFSVDFMVQRTAAMYREVVAEESPELPVD